MAAFLKSATKSFSNSIVNLLIERIQDQALGVILREWSDDEGYQEWQFIHVPEVVAAVTHQELQGLEDVLQRRATNSVLEVLQRRREPSAPHHSMTQVQSDLYEKMQQVLEQEHMAMSQRLRHVVQEFVDGLQEDSCAKLLTTGEQSIPDHPDLILASDVEIESTQETEPNQKCCELEPQSNELTVTQKESVHELAGIAQQISTSVEQLESFGTVLDRIPGPVGQVLRWFHHLREPDRKGIVAAVMTSKRFETLSMVSIIANLFFILYETNNAMNDLAQQKSYSMQAIELLFTSFYVCEIGAKLYVHRAYFFCCGEFRWNVFDFTLVVLAVIDLLLEHSMNKPGMTNAGIMRLFRILRMAKIFRVIRLLRFFSELRLIMTCIAGSLCSLFWSVLMLTAFTLVVAIVLVQGLATFLVDGGPDVDPNTRHAISKYFGSVQLTTLTMFKAMGGGNDWDVYMRELEKTGFVNAAVFFCFMLFVWLSMGNVITSLYVEKALKLAQPDMEELLFSKHKEDFAAANELKRMLRKIDSDDNGQISYVEFQQCVSDFNIRTYFEMRGLAIKDTEMFFKMLMAMSDTDHIGIDSFVGGCMKMKGVATNIDLVMLHYEVKIMHRAQREMYEQLRAEMAKITSPVPNRSI